jgi:hypothetical protein
VDHKPCCRLMAFDLQFFCVVYILQSHLAIWTFQDSEKVGSHTYCELSRNHIFEGVLKLWVLNFFVLVRSMQMNFYFSVVSSYVRVLHRLLLVFAFGSFYLRVWFFTCEF